MTVVIAVVALALSVTGADSHAQLSALGQPHVFASERIDPGGPAPVAEVQSELLVAGDVVTAHVEYGTTPAYGQRTPEELEPTKTLSAKLTDLQFGVEYQYRMVATVDGVPFAGPNATLFLPYPALHLPARLDVRIAAIAPGGRTRVRNLTLSEVPPGTLAEVSTCVFRRDPECRKTTQFTTTGGPTVFLRGRTFGPRTGVAVTAYQPDGQVIDTIMKFLGGGAPQVSVSCGLARPGERNYSEQPCVAIRTVSRAGSAALRLRVEGVQDGMTIEVRCRGGGCPQARSVYPVEVPVAGVGVTVTPTGYSRLRPGSVLEVLVTRPRTTGVERRITVGRRQASVSEYRCVARDSLEAVIGCPADLHLPFPAAPAAIQLY
jgi:hypothetical protein